MSRKKQTNLVLTVLVIALVNGGIASTRDHSVTMWIAVSTVTLVLLGLLVTALYGFWRKTHEGTDV